MSEFELHVLITDHLRDMHGMIEFWVSATFAVIVARFVAVDRLSRRVLWVMAVLYAMATLLSFTRYMLLVNRVGIYQAELARLGLAPFEQPQPLAGTMAVLVLGLYGAGTVAAIYFLLGAGGRARAQRTDARWAAHPTRIPCAGYTERWTRLSRHLCSGA